MADKSERINFIKTFLNTADVMMNGLQIEDGADMWYWRSARDVAGLYPVLKLAAMELNQDLGFRVQIPEDNPKGAFPTAEAFYYLYREIVMQAEWNDSFAHAQILFNPDSKDFVKEAGNVSARVVKKGDEFERYWLNRCMILAAAYTGEMQDEIFSGMLDEFLETQLAERMMSTVIRRGGTIDGSDVEGVRQVLSRAAEDFSKVSGYVSEKQITSEMIKRLQQECRWDARSEPVQITVAEFTDPFTKIVAKSRANFYKYYRNHDMARMIATDFDNVMSDEAYFKLERNCRFDEQLGIREAEITLPEHYDLNKIFNEVDNFDELNGTKPLFESGPLEEYWDNYECAENIDAKLMGSLEKVILYLVESADNNLYEVGELLREQENKSESGEQEDNEFSEAWNSFAYEDMSGDVEKRKAILDLANDILDVSAVVKNHYGIELNDTPVDRRIVKGFTADARWNDFTFSSLYMLFNAFDRNLDENQGVLHPGGNVSLETIDEIMALPQSLEKRNALKIFGKGLCKLEDAINENLGFVEAGAVEDFSSYHQDDYWELTNELRWGQEVFDSFTDEVVERLTDDINTAAVLNYVIPIYDDTKPDISAPRKTLEELYDYENQPRDTQKYIKALTRRHIARVLKTHNEILDCGDFDRDLFADVEDINRGKSELKRIADVKQRTEVALVEEEKVYKQFRSFRKTHPDNMQMLINRLWQGRMGNN